jgi:hypothetical protein
MVWGVEAEVVTWKHHQPAVHLATMLHETTHAVTRGFLRQVPLWMIEGSADWFGRPAWANGNPQRVESARRWHTLKMDLENKRLPPLRDYLETVSYKDWDRLFAGNIGRGYLVGYSLYDFFMSQPPAQRFLATVVTSRDLEFSPDPAKEFVIQLDKHWRGGLAAFERSWHEWIRSKAAAETAQLPRKK